ncbi:hypothetical protein PoB_002636000 [Plakobranchus ocellatus]|uniref:Uncharacterized protein n=1 Tax=Plakobranchus ocellatus TaxID=259542 RepID=A0AAV3ZXD2_9GAST|nr:hypothetical protein PoB_002636000 [Plakobranchus ocellatus]
MTRRSRPDSHYTRLAMEEDQREESDVTQPLTQETLIAPVNGSQESSRLSGVIIESALLQYPGPVALLLKKVLHLL